MDLTVLGYDEWLAPAAAACRSAGHRLARVTAVDRGAFLVRHEDGELHAELAGKFRFTVADAGELPCVGDWVAVQGHPGGVAIIHGVVPRRTCLRRKAPGKTADFQWIAANLDGAFIVQACDYDFNLARLDRYLVMAHEGAVTPCILLTKTDLLTTSALAQVGAQVRQTAGATPVVALSNLTGAGLDEFRARLLPGRTYCLLGSSGVGKSTLINRLLGHAELSTQTVSATGEGVHTTVRRQLLLLDHGTLLIDTPGMRELGLLGANSGLADTFPELRDHLGSCRFANCTHTAEPGCAVLQALADGTLDADRYQSYRKLQQESAFHELSYVEKRRKDRAFGKFLKTAKKTLSE